MIVMIALFKSFLVELVCFRFYLKSFFLDGHGTKYKKCMGTQNPRFFPLMGTVPSTKYCWAPGSCPSVKILSKSVRHGSLGVGRHFDVWWDFCCSRTHSPLWEASNLWRICEKKANFSSSDNSKQTLQTTLFFLGSKEKQLCFLLFNQKYLQTYHLYP